MDFLFFFLRPFTSLICFSNKSKSLSFRHMEFFNKLNERGKNRDYWGDKTDCLPFCAIFCDHGQAKLVLKKLRSIVCDTLAFLLFICLLHNGRSPMRPWSTNLYTQMTTNGQGSVNRWPIKSLQKRLWSLFIAFSSHVLGIYL